MRVSTQPPPTTNDVAATEVARCDALSLCSIACVWTACAMLPTLLLPTSVTERSVQSVPCRSLRSVPAGVHKSAPYSPPRLPTVYTRLGSAEVCVLCNLLTV